MKHESRFGAHIGTSSLLLIFLTLSLVSFGALSLAGAKADERLSEKLGEHTAEYYAACHEAEAFAAETDAKLHAAWEESASPEDYFLRAAAIDLETSVPMNGSQTLAVTLEAINPYSPGDGTKDGGSAAPASGRFFRIVKWRIENSDDASYERHLPVSGSGGLSE